MSCRDRNCSNKTMASFTGRLADGDCGALQTRQGRPDAATAVSRSPPSAAARCRAEDSWLFRQAPRSVHALHRSSLSPAARAYHALDGWDGPRGGRYLKHRPPQGRYRPLPGPPSAARCSAAASRPSTSPPRESPPPLLQHASVHYGLRLSLGSAVLPVCARRSTPDAHAPRGVRSQCRRGVVVVIVLRGRWRLVVRSVRAG